jgi:hypothetical protein
MLDVSNTSKNKEELVNSIVRHYHSDCGLFYSTEHMMYWKCSCGYMHFLWSTQILSDYQYVIQVCQKIDKLKWFV